jgi:hypothetical protein
LSVNVVVAPAVDEAQPSGIFTENAAPGGVNATKAWLSGMSPGGLDSVAGCPDSDVDAEEVTDVGADALGDGGAGVPEHADTAHVTASISPPSTTFRPHMTPPGCPPITCDPRYGPHGHGNCPERYEDGKT